MNNNSEPDIIAQIMSEDWIIEKREDSSSGLVRKFKHLAWRENHVKKLQSILKKSEYTRIPR